MAGLVMPWMLFPEDLAVVLRAALAEAYASSVSCPTCGRWAISVCDCAAGHTARAATSQIVCGGLPQSRCSKLPLRSLHVRAASPQRTRTRAHRKKRVFQAMPPLEHTLVSKHGASSSGTAPPKPLLPRAVLKHRYPRARSVAEAPVKLSPALIVAPILWSIVPLIALPIPER